MGTIWKWLNRNSGGVVALVMAISAIAGITTFIWTEINSLKTEVGIARTEIEGLRTEIELLREDTRLTQEELRLFRQEMREEMRLFRQEMREELDGMETRLRADMERNHQQLTQALIDHVHAEDGSAIFKAPLDSSQ